MKKIFIIIIATLFSLSLFGQNKFNYEIQAKGGLSIGDGQVKIDSIVKFGSTIKFFSLGAELSVGSSSGDFGDANITITGTTTTGSLQVGDPDSHTIATIDSIPTDGTTFSIYSGGTQLAPNIPSSGAGELGDYAKLLVDTIGIYSFGAGSGADADSTLFEINDNEFGSYYNYTDTLYVVNFKNIKISADDSLNFNCYYGNYMTGVAVDSLFDAPEPVGDNQGILTPDNFKIPPDSDVWIGISGAQITGKRPKEWVLQMNGYLIRDH